MPQAVTGEPKSIWSSLAPLRCRFELLETYRRADLKAVEVAAKETDEFIAWMEQSTGS